MKKQKTLLVTSIYAKLWGTEFGGRPSREHHYKISLLSILNMKPSKVICFTSPEEIVDLENFFYRDNQISKEFLELKIFDLKNTRYFEKIFSKKDLEVMKNFDRCFEIQYNKFFWTDELFEMFDYDKVYWFDAGLSHGGLFPEQYSYGSGYEKNFRFNLFNENFLNKINDITDDKFLLVGKNNNGAFYWSTTLPHIYYNEFKKDYHVIGGFYGGTPENFRKMSRKFDSLVFNLLRNETELYMEEQILSCMYYNSPDEFNMITFDDWYKKDNHEENTKYFYEIFLTDENQSKEINDNSEISDLSKTDVNEIIPIKKIDEIEKTNNVCVAAISIEMANNTGKNYASHAKHMVDTYLEHTTFDIVVLTDAPERFSEYNERVKVVSYDDNFTEEKKIGGFFNYHLKRLAIKTAKDLDYETILYVDCDCYLVGWDNESFIKKCSEDFDMAFVSHAHPQLGDLRKTYQHFQNKIDTEYEGLYYDELDMSPNPAETHVLIKNNEKLEKFLEFWDKVSKNNKHNLPTYHDGVYFGTSGIYAKMNMIGMTHESKFIDYCRISHGDNTLNFFGHTIN